MIQSEMEEDRKLLDEAADGLYRLVQKFSEFRETNFRVNELLKEVETIRAKISKSSKVEVDAVAGSSKRAKRFKWIDKCIQELQDKEDKGPPEQQVFNNGLLMKIVVQNVTEPNDLLACRLVNSCCNFEATNRLLKTDCLHIHLTNRLNIAFWKLQRPIVLRDDEPDPPDLKLEELTYLLTSEFVTISNTHKFPCTSFTFEHGSLSMVDLQDFLNAFGRKIKTLRLDIGTSSSVEEFSKFVNFQVPQLQNLIIRQSPESWMDDETIDEESFKIISIEKDAADYDVCEPFSKLIYFRFSENIPVQILEPILNSAKDLQELYFTKNPPSFEQYFALLVKLDRLYLLKRMQLKSTMQGPEMIDLAIECPPLTHLCLPRFENNDPNEVGNLGQIAISILERSAMSLKVIKAYQLDWLGGFAFPKLPALEQIIVGADPEDDDDCSILENPDYGDNDDIIIQGRLFPAGFMFSYHFPNLKHIDCRSSFEDTTEQFECWQTYFADLNVTSDVSTNVEKLTFYRGPPLQWMEYFTFMFPNITDLRIEISYLNRKFMILVVTLVSLRSLELRMVLSETRQAFPYLDAVLTGFTKETCRKLFNEPINLQVPIDAVYMERFRAHKSIWNLQELEYLKLVITENKTPYDSGEPIITHVAGQYAFQLCPKLKSVDLVIDGSNLEKVRKERIWSMACPIFGYIRSAKLQV